jgi:hypothetical protein
MTTPVPTARPRDRDVTYELLPGKQGWRATMKSGGKTTVLIDGVGRSREYTAACHHQHYGVAREPKAVAK